MCGARYLAFFTRDDVALIVSRVHLTRAVDAGRLVVHELEVLSNPTRQAAHPEQNGEEVGREAHGPVNEASVEVDVRVQLAVDEVVVLEGDFFQVHGDFEEIVVNAKVVEHAVCGRLHNCSARIVALVDAH